MSRNLTLELSDRTYDALEKQARKSGVSAKEWATSALIQILIKYNDDDDEIAENLDR